MVLRIQKGKDDYNLANAVIMPKAGITVESCIIGTWEKKVGDAVKVGDVLFTYETDKASFECESTAEGTLLDIFYGVSCRRQSPMTTLCRATSSDV